MDFALWRVNQEAGSTSAPFRFTNSDFRGDGGMLGNAVTWLAGEGLAGRDSPAA